MRFEAETTGRLGAATAGGLAAAGLLAAEEVYGSCARRSGVRARKRSGMAMNLISTRRMFGGGGGKSRTWGGLS
jgi:hypothetical protein